jgi:3-methyladenine DNA glycosylase/8-oxoguanine DNA glycosylase
VTLLPIEEPFDLVLTTERFRAFGVDRATVWHEGGLLRAVGGREVRIEAAPGGVDVEPLDAETLPVVRTVLGLVFELRPFYAWADGDDVLGPATRRLAGFRPSLAPDPFEMLVGAITAQQVSLYAAVAIRNRMTERFGEPVGDVWSFPERSRLASATEDDLVSLGFSRRKAEYTIGLARADVDLEALAGLPDDEVRSCLVALRGIGEWTAEWFLARHLARPHAWPWGDLALRKAVADLYRGLDVRAGRERFHPYENLSAHYLLLARRIP